jgi:hypothetical protein
MLIAGNGVMPHRDEEKLELLQRLGKVTGSAQAMRDTPHGTAMTHKTVLRFGVSYGHVRRTGSDEKNTRVIQ